MKKPAAQTRSCDTGYASVLATSVVDADPVLRDSTGWGRESTAQLCFGRLQWLERNLRETCQHWVAVIETRYYECQYKLVSSLPPQLADGFDVDNEDGRNTMSPVWRRVVSRSALRPGEHPGNTQPGNTRWSTAGRIPIRHARIEQSRPFNLAIFTRIQTRSIKSRSHSAATDEMNTRQLCLPYN